MAEPKTSVEADRLTSLIPGWLLVGDHLRTRIGKETTPTSRLTVAVMHHGTGPLVHEVHPPVTIEAYEQDSLWDGIFGISYLLAGSGSILDPSGGSPRRVQTGDLVRFTHYESRTHCLTPEPGLLECTVCFDLSSGRRMQQDGLWVDRGPVTAIGVAPELVQAFLSLFQAMAYGGIAHVDLRWRLVQLLALAEQAAEAADPESGLVAKAKRLLAERLEPSFSVADAARLLTCSPVQLHRRFLRATGVTPGRWQLRRRLDRATELLREHPVNAVAGMLGYTDPAVFSRQFRKEFGVVPKAWGRSVRD